ncbi:MAG: hypothetical protein DME98_02760 [Verrucomicrobia bacterium]|nr:MAG: hypothetical protein DME98_02760 [Verrucomicrobiota bacterium]PYJ34161.1 MAG: hypothetical protein DME88_05995 [Verrucomicrobiota bacterium]
MKAAFYSLVVTAFVVLTVRADLTIVYSTTVQPASHAQKPQATPTAVATTNMTIRVKGDKARIDASPQVTAIFDGRTGELINLLNDQKTIVRISPEKMRAIADMLNKFSSNKAGADKPRLTPTGQREMINGYDTEQYTYEGPDFKATYWIAPKYPNGGAVLAQLQSIKSELWDAANTKMPDFRDFPGLPIRMRMIVDKENHASEHGASDSGHLTEITTTVTGVSLDSIADNEFTVPANFKETQLPDIFNKNAAPTVSPKP